MRTELLIVDDFYSHPVEVYEWAKTLEFFDNYGNHPGVRTKEVQDPSVKNAIQHIIQNAGGQITNWEDMQYNGCFNACTSMDRTWIHADQYNEWAAVVYLNPNPHSLQAGTGLFRHIETGYDRVPRNEDGSINHEILDVIYKDSTDWTRWEMTDYVANKFNRFVTYRGDLFHSAVNYFGNSFDNARFHQTFFYNTER